MQAPYRQTHDCIQTARKVLRRRTQVCTLQKEQFLNEDGMWRCPYDKSLDDEYEAKRQCFISNNVKIIYDVSEQQKYVEDNYGKDFINLCRVETMKDFFEKNKDFPYPTKLTDNYDSIIRYFHKSIYSQMHL